MKLINLTFKKATDFVETAHYFKKKKDEKYHCRMPRDPNPNYTEFDPFW